MATTPLSRTMQWFRRFGWEIDVCERYNSHSRTRADLFGYADAVAYHPNGGGVILVQATTASHISARLKKIRGIAASKTWLNSAARRIIVIGWKQEAGLLGKWVPRAKELQKTGDTVAFVEADLIVPPPDRRKRTHAKQEV